MNLFISLPSLNKVISHEDYKCQSNIIIKINNWEYYSKKMDNDNSNIIKVIKNEKQMTKIST